MQQAELIDGRIDPCFKQIWIQTLECSCIFSKSVQFCLCRSLESFLRTRGDQWWPEIILWSVVWFEFLFKFQSSWRRKHMQTQGLLALTQLHQVAFCFVYLWLDGKLQTERNICSAEYRGFLHRKKKCQKDNERNKTPTHRDGQSKYSKWDKHACKTQNQADSWLDFKRIN